MAENHVYLLSIVVTRCVVAKITDKLVIMGFPKQQIQVDWVEGLTMVLTTRRWCSGDESFRPDEMGIYTLYHLWSELAMEQKHFVSSHRWTKIQEIIANSVFQTAINDSLENITFAYNGNTHKVLWIHPCLTREQSVHDLLSKTKVGKGIRRGLPIRYNALDSDSIMT